MNIYLYIHICIYIPVLGKYLYLAKPLRSKHLILCVYKCQYIYMHITFILVLGKDFYIYINTYYIYIHIHICICICIYIYIYEYIYIYIYK